MTFNERFSKAWNAFFNKDPTDGIEEIRNDISYEAYGTRPDGVVLTGGKNKSIVSMIHNRLAVDVSSVPIYHAKIDDNGRYLEKVDDGLNNCLSFEANIDQSGKELIRDVVLTLCDVGTAAIIPIDTDVDPASNLGKFKIHSLRCGTVTKWYPTTVEVDVYNDRTGNHQTLLMPKSIVAIIHNPFYIIMNEPNSTAKRLEQKLALLDRSDIRNHSGKWNLLLQLPYSIRNSTRKKLADQRLNEIQNQLSNSPYGIAYTDGTEKVIQLNGSAENKLQEEIEYLTNSYYNQLGFTKGIFDGTATSSEMNNYQKRTVEVFLTAITESLERKFLVDKNGKRKKDESILFINDPFRFIDVNAVSEIADKFTRNEILTANEVRQIVGVKPAADPNADVLRNKNISAAKGETRFDKDGNEIPTSSTDPQDYPVIDELAEEVQEPSYSNEGKEIVNEMFLNKQN